MVRNRKRGVPPLGVIACALVCIGNANEAAR